MSRRRRDIIRAYLLIALLRGTIVGVGELFTDDAEHWSDIVVLGYVEDDHTLAMGFARVADIAVDAWEAGSRSDLVGVPVVYLYRHAIELALKQAIREASALMNDRGPVEDRDTLDKALAGRPFGHDLAALARKLDTLLGQLGLEALPDNAKSTLAELHESDPRGEAWRYASEREHNSETGRISFVPVREKQQHVDIVALRERLREVFSVLSFGVMTMLSQFADYRREMLEAYGFDTDGYYL